MLISPSSATKDSSVPISLPLISLPCPHPTESLELGTTAYPSSAIESSPTSLPSQVSTPCSPTLLFSHIPPLKVYVTIASEHTDVRTHTMTTRSMNDIYKPKKSFVVTKHPLPPCLEPTTIFEALTDSN
uniref:Uncharacterized protein n=1 Tax=Populus alba TaxID=43335 RepID=A0A4U5LSF1_POPAL|nr:hypothetical protein D5086_0000326830 [Populus alba]